MKLCKLKRVVAIVLIAIAASSSLLAHSGRTDSSGGHRDTKNKSGLGSYHYHCGGYPAHLHDNGVCPYKSSDSTSNSTVTTPLTLKYTEKVVDFSIDGESSKIDAIVTNNTNLVELRTLCDKLDVTINSYDATMKSIECQKGDVKFTLQINSKNMWKDEELITLDVAPVAYNDRTMIPARVVAEAIGKTVTYDLTTDSIVIS